MLKQAFSVFKRVFFNKNDVECAKTRYFVLKKRFMHIIGFNARKALGNVKRIELCGIRLTRAETNIFLRLNAFFSKMTLNALNGHFALKTRFLPIIGFNAINYWETYKRIELCICKLTNAKTSFSLRSNAFFFCKSDVK